MGHYIGLILVIIISFISIFSYDMFNHEDKNEMLDFIKVFAPGILFSIFIVFHISRKINLFKSIIYFLILMVGYYVNFYIGGSTWGLAVPIAGGLGGALISIILNKTQNGYEDKALKFIGLGILSSFIGLVIYYIIKDRLADGVGFGAIIVLWQLMIGIEFLRQIQKLKGSDIVDKNK